MARNFRPATAAIFLPPSMAVWNRSKRTGYKVIRIIVKDGAPTGE
jgi:hypothetical protein